MITRNSRFVLSLSACAALLVLSACGGNVKSEAKYPSGLDRGATGGDDSIYGEKESIFGQDGIKLLGGKKKNTLDESAMGVNFYLWRASLDTVSFMPLTSADPFGGVIITDWYTNPATPNERLKLNIFITGRELKADGVSVRAFRQVASKNAWVDAEVSPDTTRKLEDSILTRARELRVSKLASEK